MIRVFGIWCRPKGDTMSVSEALGLMFTFGLFILALLTYIDRQQKK